MLKLDKINVLKPELLIKWLTYIFLVIYLTLNFVGSPILKFIYPVFIILTLASIVSSDFKKSIIPLIALSFVEGQGRILWSYHPVMRLIFDFSVGLAFLKAAISHKKIFPVDKMSKVFALFVVFHFLWFGVQLFNIKNVGFLGVLSASKAYIFPFFAFFLFLLEPIHKDEKLLVELRRLVCFLFIAEGYLSIFQMSQGEEFLYKISSYYMTATRDIFVGIAFRPFATSHLPGAMSTYFMLTIPFLFLSPIKNPIEKGFIALAAIISIFALFIMQVRASLIKEVLILMIIFFLSIFNSTNRLKDLIKSFSLSFILLLMFIAAPPLEKMFPDLNLEMATERLLNLTEVNKLSSHRIKPTQFMSVVKHKLIDNPLGLGPGRTGAAAGPSVHKIKADPEYGLDYSWTHDNLYISLVIDLGIGVIFYLFLIIGLPAYLIQNAFKMEVTSKAFRVILLSTITPIVLILGNWGALGIPYNPESFYFWFWIAVGVNQIYETRHKENEIPELKASNSVESPVT